MMEKAVNNLENQMYKTNEKLDDLALKVNHVKDEIVFEGGAGSPVDVNHLLQSVKNVNKDYQNLRNDILEVQDLQKQLSSSLQLQMRLLQLNCNTLKEKLALNVPVNLPGVPKASFTTSLAPGKTLQDDK